MTFMLFLGMANAYVMRTNMSVAIVAMVSDYFEIKLFYKWQQLMCYLVCRLIIPLLNNTLKCLTMNALILIMVIPL